MFQIIWVIATRSEAKGQYPFNYCALHSREPLNLRTSLHLRLRAGSQFRYSIIDSPGVSDPPVVLRCLLPGDCHHSSSFQSSPRGGIRIGLVVERPPSCCSIRYWRGITGGIIPFQSSDCLTTCQGFYPAVSTWSHLASHNH